MALPVVPGRTMSKALFEPLHDSYSETTVKFYDPYVEFDKFYSLKHKKNLFVNPVNNHPGSATHYFYALYLTEMLERDFADVLGEKSEESLLSGIININECTPCGVDLELVEQTQGNVRYKFCYPEEGTRRYLFTKTERYCLNYPLGKGYIKLSFENPADIKDVELSGAPSGKTEIYYTKVNEKLGYDDNTLYPVSLTENDGCFSGTPNKTKITSICIHIDDGAYPDGKLELTINS
ncbi:MAG: hypothetical protein IJS90_04920, partial [Clostridia bacterium]|nr:hypothetical protein [Clostridia bacterium]